MRVRVFSLAGFEYRLLVSVVRDCLCLGDKLERLYGVLTWIHPQRIATTARMWR
ncbi:unnamed protein product [Pylaiella littoralis]